MATQIPADDYMPLLARTDKPIAIAAGGFSPQGVRNSDGTPKRALEV